MFLVLHFRFYSIKTEAMIADGAELSPDGTSFECHLKLLGVAARSAAEQRWGAWVCPGLFTVLQLKFCHGSVPLDYKILWLFWAGRPWWLHDAVPYMAASCRPFAVYWSSIACGDVFIDDCCIAFDECQSFLQTTFNCSKMTESDFDVIWQVHFFGFSITPTLRFQSAFCSSADKIW